MCKVSVEGHLQFGLREWLGILAAMTGVAAITSSALVFAMQSHSGDTQVHESSTKKTERIYDVVDREMRHHYGEGHAGVEERLDEINDRLTSIEAKLP